MENIITEDLEPGTSDNETESDQHTWLAGLLVIQR